MRTKDYRLDRRALILLLFGILLIVSTASCATLGLGQGATESISTEGQLFHWHREGGIAGFCDDVTIVSIATARVSNCKTSPPESFANVPLTAEEQATLSDWLGTYDTDTYEQSDPATADAMMIAIEFYGEGSTSPDETVWQLMDRFAQRIIGRANR